MSARVPRTTDELIARLKDHCAILEEFHQKACIARDPRYLGEVAGKLRVLVYKSPSNRPLLLDLMAQANAKIPITLNGPRGATTTDLVTYLGGFACAIRLRSNELAELSRTDLVALWAQQSGGAHEDWALDERLAAIFAGGLSINDQPIHGVALCGICRTVLHVARAFLASVA